MVSGVLVVVVVSLAEFSLVGFLFGVKDRLREELLLLLLLLLLVLLLLHPSLLFLFLDDDEEEEDELKLDNDLSRAIF